MSYIKGQISTEVFKLQIFIHLRKIKILNLNQEILFTFVKMKYVYFAENPKKRETFKLKMIH